MKKIKIDASEKLLLSKIVSNIREKCNISQVEFSHVTGVSLPTIQNIESGKMTNPRLKTLINICKPFKIKLSNLLNQIDENSIV